MIDCQGDAIAKAEFLLAVASPHRLRILQALKTGELPAGGLADLLGLSKAAISQHLARLKLAGLVKARRDAQNIFYSIKADSAYVILEMLSNLFAGREAGIVTSLKTRDHT